jgi:hypothetical protein
MRSVISSTLSPAAVAASRSTWRASPQSFFWSSPFASLDFS